MSETEREMVQFPLSVCDNMVLPSALIIVEGKHHKSRNDITETYSTSQICHEIKTKSCSVGQQTVCTLNMTVETQLESLFVFNAQQVLTSSRL